MSLWAVTMVRDELDVLPYTLTHLANEGVDGLIVADNLSTDGTWDMLQDLAQDPPFEMHLIRDREVGYYQSQKMTGLYQRASSMGAKWVIPFDADEVWCSPDGRHLADVFANMSSLDGADVSLFNYYPTSDDPAGEPNPFRRISNRDPKPAPLPKVAVAAGIDSLVVEQGNHGVHADVALPWWRSNLEIGHFPWRSPEQFERKVRNGARAYAATDLPVDYGGHWREHGRILEESGPAALRAVYDEWYLDPPIDLVHRPVPWRG